MSRVLRIQYSTCSNIDKKDKSNLSKLKCQKVSKKRYSRVSTRVSKYSLSTLGIHTIGTKVTQKLKNSKKSLDHRQQHESGFLEATFVRRQA